MRKILSGLLFVILAICSSVTVWAASGSKFLPSDAPVAEAYPNSWTVLENTTYVTAYDETFKNPAWVAYHLKGPSHKPAERPDPGYPTDDRTQSKLAADEYPSGYDHGHMASNNTIGSFYDANAQTETFFMTNMVPQRHGLNAGPWKTIETNEVKWADLRTEIWVICGPVYTTSENQPIDPKRKYGIKKLGIPTHCFKIIICKNSAGKFETLAFIMPQEKASGHKPREFLVSIREVEERTGLNFFANLSAKDQDEIEEDEEKEIWPLR